MNRSILAIAVILAGFVPITRSLAMEPIEVGDRACLFLDDHYIAEQAGLTRTWHQGKPAAAPAINADLKAGEDWPHMFGSVFYDPQDKLYKMFYESVAHGKGWLRYAESSDGKTWTKPKLGLLELNGSRDNNVVFAPGELPNAFIDPKATDPKGRIKIIAWCGAQKFKGKDVGGLYLFQSADGRDWDPVGTVNYSAPNDDTASARVVLDTNQILWDRLGKRYYGTFRSFPTHPGLPGFVRDENNQTTYGVVGGHRRAVAVSTSPDIVSGWPPSQTILRADAKDDEKAARLSKDPAKLDYCELYIMPTFVYGNHYLGMVSLLFNIDGSDTVSGAGDVQFTFSHDGMKWHRQPERQTFVAPTSKGLVPCYAQCSEPLVIGDEMWIYYSEADSAHPKTGDLSQIHGASWRRDGFVSLDATEKPAVLTTHPLKFTGSKLVVNANVADGGLLRVGLVNEAGQPIPGLGIADCDPLRRNHVAKEVTWRQRSDISALTGKPLRLAIELTQGSLYSFRTAP
jgi:hypothetical protein